MLGIWLVPLFKKVKEILFLFLIFFVFLCIHIFSHLCSFVLPLPVLSLCPEPDVVYTGCCYCFVVAFGLEIHPGVQWVNWIASACKVSHPLPFRAHQA